MRQLTLPLGLGTEASFENFLPGGNAQALAHLRALVMPAAPVYLWGPAGCGKSHLLQALVRAVRQAGGQAAAYGAGRPTPWPLPQERALAVIDDCQALDPAAQQSAFQLFIDAASQGAQIVAAGRLPPVDLPLREDLRTRLGWGHVFALAPLGDAEVRAALRQAFDRRGVFLPDDLMSYLQTRFERDLGHLVALLDRLDEFALANKRAVTLPLLRQMLAEEGQA